MSDTVFVAVISIVTTLITGGLGAGGFVAWRRLNHDKKIGVAAQEVVEEDSEAARWRSIIETQTNSLLEPMRRQLAEHATKIQQLEQELATSKRKYWLAIAYIRQLLAWLNRHLPDDMEDTVVPEAHALLADDI
jgi:hypothetical protein